VYDAVVIGAGPAGSMAASEIATAGFKTLLLEKHAKPGIPLCCAEAVTCSPLHSLLEPKKEWIKTEIDYIKICGPDKTEFTLNHPRAGYVLDRKVFDLDLARRAMEAGCQFECNTIGKMLRESNGLFNSLEIENSDGVSDVVEASLFIAADGAESKIARQAGINNLLDLEDIDSLLQYRVDNIAIDPKAIEFHFGQKLAPGGYLWVFPKSESSANVGLGITINGKRSELLKANLDSYIKERYPGARVTETHCGIVPKYQGRDRFRKSNLLVVGDAARELDSLTGAGIINAMKSGRYAGLAAIEYLSGNRKNPESLGPLYPGKFLEEKEKELDIYLKLHNVYLQMTDDDIKNVIAVLNDYFGSRTVYGVNTVKLLATLVRTRPQLLRLVRHIF